MALTTKRLAEISKALITCDGVDKQRKSELVAELIEEINRLNDQIDLMRVNEQERSDGDEEWFRWRTKDGM